MITIIFAILLVIDAVEMFCFDGNALYGTITAVICIGYLVLRLIMRDKLKIIIATIYAVAGFASAFACLSIPRTEGADGGIIEYNRLLIEAADCITQGNFEKAEDILLEAEDIYGGYNSETITLKMLMLIKDGNYSDANGFLYRADSNNGELYYALKEQIMLANPDTTESELERMYISAAEDNPNWPYAVMMAGISEYNRDNLNAANYWLLTADRLEPGNCLTEYYLGVLNYKFGEYENALFYFDLAVEHDADEVILDNIAGYLDKLGYWN